MWDTLRKAVITHKINDVKEELQRAGQSLEELFTRPDLLDRLDSETAWGLIRGLETSFTVLEGTVRGVLKENDKTDSEVRRTLRDVQAAITTLQTTLGSFIPYVEMQYGLPPKDVQWKVENPYK